MNEIMLFARGDDGGGHLLLEAARLALEANPQPRMIRFRVTQAGTPIEITEEPNLQLEE